MKRHNPLDDPQPGFFKLRAVKTAPMVAAAIFLPCPIDPFYGFPLDRPRHLQAHINGQDANLDRVWMNGELIKFAEYRFLMADRDWASKYAPHLPEANPSRGVNIRDLAPVAP